MAGSLKKVGMHTLEVSNRATEYDPIQSRIDDQPNIQPLVWVIVLNYNSLEDTLSCVDSFNRIRYLRKKLLVIDNSSPDGSGLQLRKHLKEDDFYQCPKNTGYAGGNNIGISLALKSGADYVFIVNPDIRLPPTSIEDYISTFNEDPSIGAINPIQIKEDGKTIDAKFANSVLRPIKVDAVTTQDLPARERFYSNDLLGAAIMISRQSLEKVGGFDPLYFAYSEESDLCRRLRLKNFALAITTCSPVTHLRTKESSGVSDFVLFLRLKGECLFNLKDPKLSLRRGIKRTMRFLLGGLNGKSKEKYPFNQYNISVRHIFKTVAWIVIRLPQIWLHRRRERVSRRGCYIE